MLAAVFRLGAKTKTMIEIRIDNEKLVKMINDNTVTVAFRGLTMFNHKVVNARKLLETIHEVADCDKETFIDYVNISNNPITYMDREKYKEIPEIKAIFHNIESQGTFRIAGHEALGNDPYIEIKKLVPVISGLSANGS